MTKTKVKIKLIKEKGLLALWSRAVKVRDNFKCVHCGARDTLESHHIFKVRHAMLKYNLDNGITLCKVCHDKIDRSYDMKQWLINWVGADRYDELDRLHYQNKKWTEVEKREIKEVLKEYIKQK